MATRESLKVDGLDFEWDTKEGLFLFEQQDSILFWISSAMKEFFDAIEEVSGEEAARVVLETTGFRQGLVVGSYFIDMDVSIQEAAKLITATYASAGWGVAEVTTVNEEEHTVEIDLRNSWEHKINVAQKKETGGDFLPAHYAGIFSGLFGRNVWYKVEHYQIEGFNETKIKYFPSDKTVDQNIHKLVRSKEENKIVELSNMVDEKTAELKELIKELSSPIIPVLEGIVVIPLLGTYDENRTRELLEKALEQLPAYQAQYVVLDLTGLNDSFTVHSASLIERLGASTRLLGTETVLVGITPKISMTITNTNIDLSRFNCFQTLQHGIHFALAQKGRRIV